MSYRLVEKIRQRGTLPKREAIRMREYLVKKRPNAIVLDNSGKPVKVKNAKLRLWKYGRGYNFLISKKKTKRR